MRKKVLFIGLALGLILTSLMPGTALAKPQKPAPPAPVSFEGTGYVTALPTYQQFSSRPTRGGYILRYKGEDVPGYLFSCIGWTDLEGATLSSIHDSTVSVDKFGNIIHGHMEGKFELSTAEGTLKGRFSGEITAGLLDPVSGFIYSVADEGRWTSTKGTGVFEDVHAGGTWALQLSLLDYVNILLWDGQYIEKGDRDGKHR